MLNCFSCNAVIDFPQAQEPCLCDDCIADINAAPLGWDEIEEGEEELTLDPEFLHFADDSDCFVDFESDWADYESYLDNLEQKQSLLHQYGPVYAHDMAFNG